MRILKIAALYELLAALCAVATTIHLTFDPDLRRIDVNVAALAIASLGGALGAASLSGEIVSVRLSLIYQILQVPRLATSMLSVALLVGPEVVCMFEHSQPFLSYRFGVLFVLLAGGNQVSPAFGINVVALFTALLFGRALVLDKRERDASPREA